MHRFGQEQALFRSAGLLEPGRPCPPRLIEALAEVGVDARAHQSHRLDLDTLGAAELVLTMEGEHVQRLAALDRTAYARTLPLREAAAVVEQAGRGPLELGELLDRANRSRSAVSYLSGGWDVADPYGGRLTAYRRAVAEIAQLVDAVIGSVIGAVV